MGMPTHLVVISLFRLIGAPFWNCPLLVLSLAAPEPDFVKPVCCAPTLARLHGGHTTAVVVPNSHGY